MESLCFQGKCEMKRHKRDKKTQSIATLYTAIWYSATAIYRHIVIIIIIICYRM